MISQVTNISAQTQSNLTSQPVVAANEFRSQKPAAEVELPLQAVQTVEAVDINTVKGAAEQINKLIQQFDRNLQFTVDEETGTNVVRVIDNESKEIIRQMPTEEMLAIAKALDKLQGLLIKDIV